MSNLKNKLQNWLNKTNKKQTNELVNSKQTIVGESGSGNDDSNSTDLRNVAQINYPLNFDHELNLFENNSLVVYIQKVTHQRQTRFRLQDSLFKIKIKQKATVKVHLLLKDLLEVFEVALKFVLNNLRTYFTAENHHIAYLTLIQEPMINGINTGKK